MMPNAAETIERLARSLERRRILAELEKCQTVEEYDSVREKLEAEAEADPS